MAFRNRTLKFHIWKNHLELAAKQDDQPPQDSEAWMHEPQCSAELAEDVSETTNQQPPASTSVSAVTDRPTTDASTRKRPSSDPEMVSDHPAKAHTVDRAAHRHHIRQQIFCQVLLCDVTDSELFHISGELTVTLNIRRVARSTIANTATQTATHQPQPSHWTQYQRGKRLWTVPYGRVAMPSTELTEFAKHLSADQDADSATVSGVSSTPSLSRKPLFRLGRLYGPSTGCRLHPSCRTGPQRQQQQPATGSQPTTPAESA